MAGLGYVFELYNVAILAFVLPVLTDQWALSSFQVGVLAAAGPIGGFIGVAGVGYMTDRVGRRRVLMLALALYSVFALISAASQNYWWLFASYLMASVGLGAEDPTLTTYLSEVVPHRVRGRFVSICTGFAMFGSIIAALIGTFLVAGSATGWRWAIALGALPALILVTWRRNLPDSPRSLFVRGKVDEAFAVVDLFERSARRTGAELPALDLPDRPKTQPEVKPKGLAALKMPWGRALFRTTLAVTLLWIFYSFVYYGFRTWMPSLLVDRGFEVAKSFGFVLAAYVAALPGYMLASWLSERIERRYALSGYCVGAALGALLLVFASNNGLVLAGILIVSFFVQGAIGLKFAYTAEIYPTEIRGVGFSNAAAFGRLAGVAAPILIGAVLGAGGFAGVFTLLMFCSAAGGLIAGVFGRRTSGRSLERITETERSDG